MSIETISFRNVVSVLPHASAINPRPDQQRGSLKTKRDATDPDDRLPKPDWIRVKAAIPTGRFRETKDIVHTHQLVTVCEEASCPNIGECWSKGTATFMIMGDKCARAAAAFATSAPVGPSRWTGTSRSAWPRPLR